MHRNLIYGTLFFVIGITFLLAPIVSASWTYQETANETTCSSASCDGNWGTSASDAVYLYANYSKPTGAEATSLWRVKDGTADINLTILQSCWDYDEDKVLFRFLANEPICLAGDTEVTMSDYTTRKIKDVEILDEVLTYNEDSGALEVNRVNEVANRSINHYGGYFYQIKYYQFAHKIDLFFCDKIGLCNRKLINYVNATRNHPFYTERDWLVAAELVEGDILKGYNRPWVIIAIDKIIDNSSLVYDIGVEENHNFFANEILVHNQVCVWHCRNATAWQELRDESFPAYEEAMWWNVTEAPPVDTCTCAGVDTDWEIDMSDYCQITEDCGLGTGTLNFTGAGYVGCDAVINTTNLGDPGSGGILYMNDSGIINVI